VDDYLEFCQQTDEPAEKPFSGKFVLRITPELHRRVSKTAQAEGVSLNSWISSAIEEKLNNATHNGDGMSFEDMERLAKCVAAILADKMPNAASSSQQEKQRPKSRAGSKVGSSR
jgi:hypothetical protein